MSQYKWWTKEETEFLINNYENLSCLEMGIKINRTHKSVESKVFKLLRREALNRKNRPVQVGQKYGRLVVLSKSDKKGLFGASYFICRCDCGKTTESPGSSLNQGTTQSCGCLNRERIAESTRLPIGESSLNRIELSYKTNAKKNKKPYELSREQFRFLISQDCYWCGDEPKPKNHYIDEEGNKNKLSCQVTDGWANSQWIKINGIDRIDSSLGYTVDNCVPCCWPCNEMKNNSNQNEFLNRVEKISEYQRKKRK